MKISAMPSAAAGIPGSDLGNAHIGTTASASKLAAAKAIAMGQEPTSAEKTPLDELAQNIRKITMRTNVSPNRAIEAEPPPAEAAESTVSDATGQASAAAELTQPISPQLAALAKERRALQVMKKELAEREAKLAKPPEGDYITKADLIANPLKIFESGLTYDQLTEAILSNQSGITPEFQALKEELKALKEGVDSRFNSQAEAQEESALNQIANDIESLSKEGDEYELFRSRNGLEKALNKIYTHYKKTGQVLDNKVVVDEVETELLDEAVKLADFKKVKSRLTPAEVQATPESQGKQMKTLTNRDGARVPLDRRARAIAAMTGTLGK